MRLELLSLDRCTSLVLGLCYFIHLNDPLLFGKIAK